MVMTTADAGGMGMGSSSKNADRGPGGGYGRGYDGGRGYGREAGKGFNRTNGITLTKEEQEAVQIKTTKAALKPIKSHLSALGKVIAHQLAILFQPGYHRSTFV